MTFVDIADGLSVFVDANTFVYHFVPHPVFQPACQTLLERIGRKEIVGFTSADVLSDVAHRVMTLEAVHQFGWTMAGVGKRLRNHPVDVKKLTIYHQAVRSIPAFGVQVLPTTVDLVLAASDLSRQHGLLSGDALIVAVMQDHGLAHLASHDADFDCVPGLTRYAPA